MQLNDIQWFFPEGPYSVDNSNPGRSWSYEKSPGIWERDEPVKLLNQFFNEIVFDQYDSENVYVIGFSQGAIICYEFIMKMDIPLGGIFPISGFILSPKEKKLTLHPAQRNTRILIGHGKQDEIVPVSASEKAYELLKGQDAKVELYLYNGKHKISINYLWKAKELIMK